MKNREWRVDYIGLIQDLYAKRAQLNQAIATLEVVLNEKPYSKGSDMSRAYAANGKEVKGGRAPESETGDTLMSAIKTVLRRSKRPLSNAEIFRKLKAAGVKFRSSNPQLSVSQALYRNAKIDGALVRVERGKWALK